MGREHHPSPRGRILLVEDDPDTARFISRVLQKRGGFDVEHAPNPPAALPRLGAERWDLVITDIEMPDMTGIELLETAAPQGPRAARGSRHGPRHRGQRGRRAARPGRRVPAEAAAPGLADHGRDRRLVERGRGGRESVLAVGAHPDDVEIGAAGALLAHRAAGA